MQLIFTLARSLKSLFILGLFAGIYVPRVFASEGIDDNKKPFFEITVEKEAVLPDYTFLNGLGDKDKLKYTLNTYIADYFQRQKQKPWLKDMDVSITLTEEYKPAVSLQTFRSISEDDKSSDFFQGHFQQQGAASLTNFGYGSRSFLGDNKESIAGVNVFYDYIPKHNHSRIGLGFEYFKANAEYRVNFYLPLSGERKVSLNEGVLNTYEKATSGIDFKIGTSFLHAPWISIDASGFAFDHNKSVSEHGYEISSRFQFTPRLYMEFTKRNSNYEDDFYGRIFYTIDGRLTPALLGNTVKNSDGVDPKRLKAVQREYAVRKITITEE